MAQSLPPVIVDQNGNILNSGNATGTIPTSASPTYSASADTTPNQSATTPTGTYSTNFKLTQGWYMALGIVVAIMLGGTPVAPFALGILGVALLYQTSQWLEHK